VPHWASRHDKFCSITRTTDELSIVCPEDWVPAEVNAARGWICLKLEGPFAFSETGILRAFLNPLAEHGIGIFAISTFDTDYVLIQAQFWPKASEVLRAAGHEAVVGSQSSVARFVYTELLQFSFRSVFSTIVALSSSVSKGDSNLRLSCCTTPVTEG
jgi:hypothetical protein